MKIRIWETYKPEDCRDILIVLDADLSSSLLQFSPEEQEYMSSRLTEEASDLIINRYNRLISIEKHPDNKTSEPSQLMEQGRKAGFEHLQVFEKNKTEQLCIMYEGSKNSFFLGLIEGLLISSYRFNKYFTGGKKKDLLLKELDIFAPNISDADIAEMVQLIKLHKITRDLVNEPVSFLNAPRFAKKIESLGMEYGFEVDTLDKKQLEALKMGGILAVNAGSIDPPSLSVMQWKPEHAVNKKPLVVVGKGVVFDAGGLNIKTPASIMDDMKQDMAGGAVVAGLLSVLALNKLPVWVIGLVPATDNRLDGNSFAPGDVIRMHNGMTVEVRNTDAEGRMIMADALSYSSKYDPELVIDIATLTGSAAYAIGNLGIVAMGNAGEDWFSNLEEAGKDCYERIARFPFWEEYDKMLESDIADLKNIGGREGGAITAGRFLSKFARTDYIHLDIAGTAFLSQNNAYLQKGATASGYRLLYHFIKKYYKISYINRNLRNMEL